MNFVSFSCKEIQHFPSKAPHKKLKNEADEYNNAIRKETVQASSGSL
jgi:hypothetical protein